MLQATYTPLAPFCVEKLHIFRTTVNNVIRYVIHRSTFERTDPVYYIPAVASNVPGSKASGSVSREMLMTLFRSPSNSVSP